MWNIEFCFFATLIDSLICALTFKLPLTPSFRGYSRIILCMRSANERWRYIVTSSLIGWAHAQNDPWLLIMMPLPSTNLTVTSSFPVDLLS